MSEPGHSYPHYFAETQIDDWFGELSKSNTNKNAIDEAYLVDDPEATYHYRTISRESPSKQTQMTQLNDLIYNKSEVNGEGEVLYDDHST